jgi:hypothetical protein
MWSNTTPELVFDFLSENVSAVVQRNKKRRLLSFQNDPAGIVLTKANCARVMLHPLMLSL